MRDVRSGRQKKKSFPPSTIGKYLEEADKVMSGLQHRLNLAEEAHQRALKQDGGAGTAPASTTNPARRGAATDGGAAIPADDPSHPDHALALHPDHITAHDEQAKSGSAQIHVHFHPQKGIAYREYPVNGISIGPDNTPGISLGVYEQSYITVKDSPGAKWGGYSGSKFLFVDMTVTNVGHRDWPESTELRCVEMRYEWTAGRAPKNVADRGTPAKLNKRVWGSRIGELDSSDRICGPSLIKPIAIGVLKPGESRVLKDVVKFDLRFPGEVVVQLDRHIHDDVHGEGTGHEFLSSFGTPLSLKVLPPEPRDAFKELASGLLESKDAKEKEFLAGGGR